MSTIELPALTCEVCGEREAVGVAAVPGVPVSCGYCRDCLAANAHPLWVLIGNTACIGGLEEAAEWWVEMVECSLRHLGKTREWFEEEVRQNIEEMEQGEED